jgi:excisionase family DNA binding protein
MFTVSEAADRLGVSAVTVKRLARSGELRVVKFGSEPQAPVRIPEDACDEYVAAHTRGGK